MATYFHGGPEVQQDGLQTLYLMNPSYAGLSENQSNLVFLNSNANSLSPNITNQQQNNHYVGIPIQSTNPSTSSPSSQDPNRQSVHVHLENPPLHGFMPRIQYNLWNPMDPSSGAVNIADMPVLRRSNQSPVATQQALSLTLSPQAGFTAMQAPTISPTSGDEIRISGSSSSTSGLTNGFSNLQSVLMGSKYLKASQELLDEVVNVGKEIKDESLKGLKGQLKINREMDSIDGNEGSDGGDSSTKQATELSTTEKQEIQMKKAKLINMLDEVEQRYKQYHHQMQIVVSSFETVAGFGSAKTYTALALQTISKQFRCLKDAISLQIRSANKSLGEEDCLGIKSESSRLRLVDHQLRQQRALQQLGMMQHNTWRPQRGLPERSVSVLRAWLFEHFLHPYPKDSDKLMLAKQTGLTRSQVSNWFINARVRLWKPMVEEMYLEETKEQERFGSSDKTENNEVNQESQSKFSTVKHNNNEIDPQNNQKIKQDSSASDVKETLHSIIHSSISPSTVNSLHNQTKFSSLMIGTTDTQTSFRDQETIIQGKFKRPCTEDQEPKSNERNNRDIGMTYDDENQSRDGYSLMGNNTNNGGGFGSYQFGEMGRFNPEHFAPRFTGNGVSLTLGLQHCENLSLSGSQQTYLTNQNLPLARRLEMGSEANDFCGINPQSSNHSANAFENINLQNRKRFAAQLLPDFVI